MNCVKADKMRNDCTPFFLSRNYLEGKILDMYVWRSFERSTKPWTLKLVTNDKTILLFGVHILYFDQKLINERIFNSK